MYWSDVTEENSEIGYQLSSLGAHHSFLRGSLFDKEG
jgi:hypothetical protein